MVSFFQNLKLGLAKTSKSLREKILGVFQPGKISPDFLDDLEEVLIQADVGVQAASLLRDKVQEQNSRTPISTTEDLFGVMGDMVKTIFDEIQKPLNVAETGPTVYLMVGVNGSGKTTTIGKLAKTLQDKNKSVIVAAGDTFRAAAGEQLAVWAKRTGATIISHQEGSDPGAVVFDAMRSAIARKADYVLVDTAGRLHTKKNLLEELKKIVRIISREVPGAPHEVILVIDGTTGQNGLSQARVFMEAVGVTGICLTKLDGSSKGGIAVAIAQDLKLPVKLVGIGESVDDLKQFDSAAFSRAIFESER